MDFQNILNEYRFILTEGAIVERLRREFKVELDPHVVHSGFIYETDKRAILYNLYKQYIDISFSKNLPILVFTPTRRANKERLTFAGLHDKNVNGDCFNFLSDLRSTYGAYSKKIYIGGLMGCKGDAYNPKDALSIEQAERFHKFQVNSFMNSGVDFLYACVLPAYSEALGLAKAMSRSKKPYVLSFVIRPNGALLDGTSLHDAISNIDALVSPKPTFYMVNCVHPSILESSLMTASDLVRRRLIGIQANTSPLSPEELDESPKLITDDLNVIVNKIVSLHKDYGLQVLGGCCGTDNQHIQKITEKLSLV
jgi:homocysteine S-methyltransferase